MACGLLTRTHKPKFIGCIYIFQHVLPILNQLSKTFQKGSVNFSHIGPAVEHAKQKLPTISSDALPVKQLQEDFKPGGRLSRIDLTPTEHHFVEMDRLLKKYVTSLITNIDNRFKASIPVLKAFSIFDIMAIPSIRSPGFKEYGDDHIKSLSKHFFAERETEENDQANVNAEKLKAEWGKFKFNLIDWKDELPRDIKEGKAATTSTTWTLHRMTCQPSFCHFFPLLFSLAERCLSIPVSNAWPERGASALKSGCL